ncbi:MAG: DUF4335 domain-containing protein, partial [Cyanobacteria bacterium P01_E01_bin.35]
MSSISHRFTPPTCTLEITGKKSPLSRWTKQDILQKLQFKLKFDDPREATTNQVTIRGKQQDLLRLQNAINHYVQEHLHASFQLLTSQKKSPATAKLRENHPYLESQGLVNHKLYFGNLLHDGDDDYIKLSTVQLFDLVTALEAFQAEIATLPDIEQSVSPTHKMLPLWGGIAAVAIAGVSITTFLFQSSQQQNTASSPETQSPATAEIPELEEIIPPPTPETAKKPISQPRLTETLKSANRLPPPPAVDTPKPKPDIPDPADYPLPEVARQSGLNSSQKSEATAKQKDSSTTLIPQSNPVQEEIIAQDSIIQDNGSEFKLAPETARLRTESSAKLPAQDRSNQLDVQSDSGVQPTRDQMSQPNPNLALRDAPAQPSQIQEITNYFQNQWQPPESLKQSLEYRLLLNPDGTVKKIIPLGKASRLYLSQTKIPVNGESFISPPTASQSTTIRLLL